MPTPLLIVAASLAWIGWFALAPALGFPDASPARVLNGVLGAREETGTAAGWIAVVTGVALAGIGYLALARAGIVRPSLRSGLGYGAFVWFVVGALVMPLLGVVAAARFESAMGAGPAMPTMPPSFMMLGSGALAALSGLIAWLLYGGILGAGRAVVHRPKAHTARPNRMIAALALLSAVEIAAGGALAGTRPDAYELWVIDQLGSGRLHIYDGPELAVGGAPTAETVDFADAASGVGDGVGEKPHMIRFNPTRTHALIPNALSGHVYVIRVSDRSVIASIDVGTDVHDVAPSRDGRVAIVSKMSDKKLGVIRTDFENETFTYEETDDLDLGALEGAGFPDNMPVCTLFPRDDRVAYVTMKGGGLYVVDAEGPLRIVKSFSSQEVAAGGCGAVTRDEKLYLGWGNSEISRLYIFDYTEHRLTGSIRVNGYGPDGHGLAVVGGGRYLWMAVRGSDSLVVVDTARDRVVGAIQSRTVLPDMPVVAPTGEVVFLSLRGPNFYEDPKPVDDRTTPGILVLEVVGEGAGGAPRGLITLPPSVSGEPPDPHGIAILPTGD